MKKHKIMILAVSIVMTINAFQAKADYTPIYTEGKVWHYREHISGAYEYRNPDFISYEATPDEPSILFDSFSFYRHYYETVVDESLVCGLPCKVVERWVEEENLPDDFKYSPYYVYRFEHEKTVYYVTPSKPIFEPQMRFDLATGDEILTFYNGQFCYEYPTYTTQSVDTIEVNGVKYNRICVNYDVMDQDCWVEGIGSMNFLSITREWIVETCCKEIYYGSPQLLEVFQDGELIFEYTDFGYGELSEENNKYPTLGLTTVSVAPTSQPSRNIYDFTGRQLQNIPGTGFYIRDGKKYLR